MPRRRQRGQVASPAIRAETLHQGLILLVTADHFAHFDLAGRPRQHHAAARAADRAHISPGEVLDDLVQVVARNDEFARQPSALTWTSGVADSRISTRRAKSVDVSNRIRLSISGIDDTTLRPYGHPQSRLLSARNIIPA